MNDLERTKVIYTVIFNDGSSFTINVYIKKDDKFENKKELVKIALSNHKNVREIRF